MELDSEGSIKSTCTQLDVTSLLSDIIFLYQLAQARPRNVLHFLVIRTGTLTVRHQRKQRESSENTFVVINGSSKHCHTYRKYTGSLQSRDTSLLDNLDGTNGVRAFTVISLRVCTLMQQGFFRGGGGHLFPLQYAENSILHVNQLWQSRVEIEHYSVAYFECITAFEAL